MKKQRFTLILLLSFVAIILMGGVSVLSADSGKLDWNKYDKYYDYEEKSPWLAVGTSIIPVWSGSFNARFNAAGVYRVLFKGTFSAVAVTSMVKGPVVLGWHYWAAMAGIGIIYDMVKSYDFVKVANKRYASLSISPRLYCRNEKTGDESVVREEGYEIDGLNISMSYRF